MVNPASRCVRPRRSRTARTSSGVWSFRARAFRVASALADTLRSSPVWMLSPEPSQYHPGMLMVMDSPRKESVIGRTSRNMGRPVSGQSGASATARFTSGTKSTIVFLLEREERELGHDIGAEFDVEYTC